MIQFLTLILLLLIVSYVFSIVYSNRRSGTTKINLPPGSFGWPFVGESLSLLRAGWEGVPERFVQERVEKHGNPLVFKTSLLGDRMAVFCAPAGNKFLFGNENKLVAAWWPSPVRKLFGRCLITIRGDEAKWMRKMLLSYLGPEAFASHYAATMDIVTRRHIQIHWQGKEEVNVFKTVKLYAFELACRLFMSLEEPTHVSKLASLFNIFLKGIIELPLEIPGTRFYSSKKAAAAIRTHLMIIIKDRKMALAEGKASSSQDLLSHLLSSSDENGKYLTDKEIANNILLLLFAGHDTSTVSITWGFAEMGRHTEDEILVECCIRSYETKPPGHWRLSRGSRGFRLYWSAVSTHKDEANFKDVMRFDPSRFEGTGPRPFTFVPFGGGPRMCLGKEFSRLQVLVFLHNIVTNFKWDLLIPNEKIEYDPMATPAKGLPVRLHPHQV
ncbi:cytochrome P450 [Cynara cardunculus var. scolymus]|uniref:Cytochrome P450 n=1 Tax=Cynara cardunculus var. scolymus TaxID=59895 RepID=A0A103YFY1_CYNCS|nr:cytochrome P450 [Cynara cardunculus var. scolymus]